MEISTAIASKMASRLPLIASSLAASVRGYYQVQTGGLLYLTHCLSSCVELTGTQGS
jgi:hypothetical protein